MLGAFAYLWLDIAVLAVCFAAARPGPAALDDRARLPDRLPLQLPADPGRRRHPRWQLRRDVRAVRDQRHEGDSSDGRLPRDLPVGAGHVGHARIRDAAADAARAARAARAAGRAAGAARRPAGPRGSRSRDRRAARRGLTPALGFAQAGSGSLSRARVRSGGLGFAQAASSSEARWAASVRLRTPSLRYSACACFFTVSVPTCITAAISRLVAPVESSANTSRSRSLRPPGAAAGAAGERCLSAEGWCSPTNARRTVATISSALLEGAMKPTAPMLAVGAATAERHRETSTIGIAGWASRSGASSPARNGPEFETSRSRPPAGDAPPTSQRCPGRRRRGSERPRADDGAARRSRSERLCWGRRSGPEPTRPAGRAGDQGRRQRS